MPIRNLRVMVAIVVSCALATATWADDTQYRVHYRLVNNSATLPKKIVVIPAGVKVFEVTAGGVQEEVPDWSAEATNSVLKSVSAAISKGASMQEILMPRLPAADAAIVDEHMALYKLVVNTASDIDLKHKLGHFDYSIGPGLATLLGRTGADAAVLIYGRDYASTAGRKTKAVLGKIPIINIFTGDDVQLGHSFIHIGLVDLKTGDLLWMNSEYRGGSSNLRDQKDAQNIVDAIFKLYPGIEQYRRAYAN